MTFDWLRPRVHLTAPRGWLNDPNGCIFYEGEWHCFYQHHPEGLQWGPMHWGHATSFDGLRWTHHGVVLAPDPELGMCYSGSAVPTAEGLALLFTHHRDKHEQQSLAWWTRAGAELRGVVLPNPGRRHFRDPKLVWFGDRWVMAITGGDRVQLFASQDLLRWSWLSDIEIGLDTILECPELALLGEQWVLIVSVSTGGPQGGSGVVFVPGTFDGTRFECSDRPRFVDYGSDYYAPQSFTGTDMSIAWMNNWVYANQVPTTPWNGSMTVPRRQVWDDGLVQLPIEHLEAARKPGTAGVALDVVARPRQAGSLVFRYAGGEEARVSWDDTAISLDRSRSGASPAPGFLAVHRAPHDGDPGTIRVIADAQSIEIFAAGGRVTLSDLVLPSGPCVGIEAEDADIECWVLEPETASSSDSSE